MTRWPLGEGWERVDDPGLLADAPDVASLAEHIGKGGGEYVRLEGPSGMVMLVPFEHRHDAYATLGLKVRRTARPRRKPGPGASLHPSAVLAAVWNLGPKAGTKAAVAEYLGCDQRTVERAVARLHDRSGQALGWRAFRAWAVAARPRNATG